MTESSAVERICIFGGTFDPIHNAHIRIAQEAQQVLQLTRVLFVPAANPPHKKPSQLAPFEDRYRMVQLACAPYPQFLPSRLEDRNEPSYSIDTVERLKQTVERDTLLYFLIGADAFEEIESWHRWTDLVKLVEFIVVTRPGADYHQPANARIHPLGGLALPVSSSGIRTRIANGEPTPELPKAVRRYIDAHSLYRTA